MGIAAVTSTSTDRTYTTTDGAVRPLGMLSEFDITSDSEGTVIVGKLNDTKLVAAALQLNRFIQDLGPDMEVEVSFRIAPPGR